MSAYKYKPLVKFTHAFLGSTQTFKKYMWLIQNLIQDSCVAIHYTGCKPATPAPRKLRQAGTETEASLRCVTRPCLKENNEQKA